MTGFDPIAVSARQNASAGIGRPRKESNDLFRMMNFRVKKVVEVGSNFWRRECVSKTDSGHAIIRNNDSVAPICSETVCISIFGAPAVAAAYNHVSSSPQKAALS
jgi:hypothetical protein